MIYLRNACETLVGSFCWRRQSGPASKPQANKALSSQRTPNARPPNVQTPGSAAIGENSAFFHTFRGCRRMSLSRRANQRRHPPAPPELAPPLEGILEEIPMHTGDLLTELLIQCGMTHVFGVPGAQTSALFDGIVKRQPAIRHIVMRDECNTTFAADAFARLTHQVGVCDVTVGPGCAKLPSGLMEAYYSSVPIL